MIYKKKKLKQHIIQKKNKDITNFCLSFKEINKRSNKTFKMMMSKKNIYLPKTFIFTPLSSHIYDTNFIEQKDLFLIKYKNIFVLPCQINKINLNNLIKHSNILFTTHLKFYKLMQTLSNKI